MVPVTVTLGDPPGVFFFLVSAPPGSAGTKVSAPEGGMLPPGVIAMCH